MVKEYELAVACAESYTKFTYNKKDLHIFGENNSVYITPSNDNSSTIVAVRGTDEVWDWIGVNFKTTHTTYGNIPDCKVHMGFYESFNLLKKDVVTTKDWGKKVIFCGHSMGGAVATLLAMEYKIDNPETDVVVYTMACPKIGNGSFNMLLDTTIGRDKLYHRKNTWDLTPFLPLWGYGEIPGENLLFSKLFSPHNIITYVAHSSMVTEID